MKKYYFLLLVLISYTNFAQITGTVTDKNGILLPFVTVLEENTYNNTTTNEQGKYELNPKTTGKHVLVFQYLGFKTKKVSCVVEKFPHVQDVKLEDENFTLNEVVVSKKNNPAIRIIKNAIASKTENTKGTDRFKADFYSRGIFKLKNMPKKIFGQKIGDFNGALDSTGSGIVSLSETFSKVTFENPDHLKEVITASKVSGNDRAYSYNTARSTWCDFYANTTKFFGINMISPLANNAFNYYKFRLESTFTDGNNIEINKIKVTAKRDKEPVFEGYIYIVENSWALYAVDLDIKGYRIQDEFLENMNLKQNFSYNKTNQLWAKTSQSLEFIEGGFGIKFSGKFTYTFSNYEFVNAFDKNTFTNQITTIETNSNKKDTVFWNKNRPIPLTLEESNDYIRKDSIHKVRNSKKYLDSIDTKENKFKIFDLISGYSYKNSFQKHSFRYDGLLDLSSLTFNTVQGWNFDSGFSFKKWTEDRSKKTDISTKLNYGFSDDRLRISGQYNHQFNNQNYANLTISGGNTINQFNPNNPISGFINTTSTLFFRDNYIKLYNLDFAKITYSQDVANGLSLKGQLEYQVRKPLLNTTDYSYFKKDKLFTSNNPLDPNDFVNSGIEKHSLAKLSLNATLHFGNKFIARPDGKYNIPNQKLPTLKLSFENAFGASNNKYDFQSINTQINYDLTMANKGKLGLNINAGKFWNADGISFVDYKHFNGNQTHIGQTDRYLNVFNLMPYYANSTNKSYFELHTEYNDKGFIMNKIPLLNHLKTNLNFGFHTLVTPNTNPYSEVTIGLDNLGFGKFRMLRLDYVRSYQNGFQGDGIIFGLKFLNIME
jgi:hypothetical protein